MTTTTKALLAAFALFVAVLIIYYGVFSTAGAPTSAVAADPLKTDRDPAGTPTPSGNGAGTSTPAAQASGNPPANRATTPLVSEPRGLLSETVQSTLDQPQAAQQPQPVDSNSAAAQPPMIDPLASSNPTVSQSNGTPTVSSPAANPTTPVVLPASNGINLNPPQPASVQRPVAPPTPRAADYTVKSGDTMSSIALAWFGEARKWKLIARENPLLDPNRLKIGQKLRLPPKDTPLTAAAKPGPVPASSSTSTSSSEPATTAGKIHTVQSGETLSSIALDAYGDDIHWTTIFEANRTALHDNPDELQVGTKLVIPNLKG